MQKDDKELVPSPTVESSTREMTNSADWGADSPVENGLSSKILPAVMDTSSFVTCRHLSMIGWRKENIAGTFKAVVPLDSPSTTLLTKVS